MFLVAQTDVEAFLKEYVSLCCCINYFCRLSNVKSQTIKLGFFTNSVGMTFQ